jgi:hypothetical protein
MKPKRQRLSRCELFLIFAPFPALWLFLGLFVNPAVFKFWKTGQTIWPLDAMTLGFVPIFFTITYLPAIILVHRNGKTITGTTVIVYAVISALLGFVLTPLP